MKKLVYLFVVILSSTACYVSAADFSDIDRNAILQIDEYINTSSNPEKSLDYLILVQKKNKDNNRVQTILWEVISHFRPTSEPDILEESDGKKSIQESLEEIAASLNKSHKYESTLSLDTLKLEKTDDEPTKEEPNDDPNHDDVDWIDVDYSNSWSTEDEWGDKFVDPDYKESREEVNYGEENATDDSEESVIIDEELKSSVQREEVSDAEEQMWTKHDKLVTEFKFDEDKVEQYRLRRVNDLRIERWLTPMTTDYRLRETARDRSLSIRAKREADHKRSPDAPYYDYPVITQRFAERGIVFENINRATSTENIWRARHTCSDVTNDVDCTDEVIADIRRIFNYFAAEESYNGVHRRTMIQPNFHVVWVSFAIDAADDKVYAVMHYGTKVIE